MSNKINTGILQETLETNLEKKPKYRGKINVEGKEYNIALYIKKSSGKHSTDSLVATIS